MLYALDSLISRILDTWKTTIHPGIQKLTSQLRHGFSFLPEKFGFLRRPFFRWLRKYYPVLTNDHRCGSTTYPRGRYGMRNPRALVLALGWCGDIRLLGYKKTPGGHVSGCCSLALAAFHSSKVGSLPLWYFR